MTEIKKALILAAGLGTRLRPLTDTMPKALVSYQGVPLLERVILRLKGAGVSHIVINIHHFADQIEEFVSAHDSFGVEIAFSDERDLLRDTGGAIKHAEKLLTRDFEDCPSMSPFVVHNVDIVSDVDLKWFFNGYREEVSPALLLVNYRKTSRYLLFDKNLNLRGWTNETTGEMKGGISAADLHDYRKFAFSGIHILSGGLFDIMHQWPEKFSIIDFYLSVAEHYSVQGCEAPEGTYLLDVGKQSLMMF